MTNGNTTFAICDNRQEVYSWGESWFGEAGNYYEKTATPKRVAIISDLPEAVDMLTIVGQTSFVVMSDGTLYGWGRNGSNELGNGGTFDQRRPEIIQNIPKVKQFIFNGGTGIVLGVDGYIYSWGKNSHGETRITGVTRVVYAKKLTVLGNNIERIFNGNDAMYALNIDGTMYGWGNNSKWQLAINNAASILPPTIIPDICDIKNIEKINNTVFASDFQGVIFGWGENKYGQIGNNTIEDVRTPFIVINNKITTTLGTGNAVGIVPITGNIDALTISVTHPVNVAYAIDPNVENGFSAADIEISNNSKVAVRVSIESFHSTPEGALQFTDVLPNSKNWDVLSLDESKDYIALGVQYINRNEWLPSVSELLNPMYAVELNNTFIGALAKSASGGLMLSAKHGLAFDREYVARHNLTFVFSLI